MVNSEGQITRYVKKITFIVYDIGRVSASPKDLKLPRVKTLFYDTYGSNLDYLLLDGVFD